MAILHFMLMKHPKIILVIILFLAFLIRGYKINTLPALNPDEAALGYNAYSLLETGKDEHGHSWPLHFESFGDYKPGGYVYLALPFIKFLGLNVLAIRLPNLILSVLTIFILYRLVLLLTKSESLSLLSSLVLTLNPWHIHFSRGAWETSIALFLLILGVYWLYSYFIRQKNIYLFLFPLPFVASLYVYHSARIVIPVLVFIIIIFNKNLFLKNLPRSIFSFLIAVVLTIPVIVSFLNNGGTARFNGVGLTADYGPTARAEELLNQHGSVDIVYRLIHNKRILYGLSWAQKYTSHFDFNFLFLNGDEVPRSKSPDMGQAYLFEIPLLIIGLIFLISRRETNALGKLMLLWLLIGPLASSLTFQAPSALRALPMSVPISVFIASGVYGLLSFFSSKGISQKILLIILSFLYFYSFGYYFDSYFIRSPQKYSFAWNTGFDSLVPYVESQKANYEQVYITDKYDQPYILYLFFSQYPPKDFQVQSQLTPPDKFGFSTISKIDNIFFSIPENIPQNSLVIDSADYQITGQSFKIYTN